MRKVAPAIATECFINYYGMNAMEFINKKKYSKLMKFLNLSKSKVEKLFNIMKFSIFICFFLSLQMIAASSYSQSTRLSLHMDNVKIKEVLMQIENKSDFYFLYNGKLVNVDKTVSINADNLQITDVLSSVFASTDIAVKVIDRQIILLPEAMASSISVQQGMAVSGNVVDESGEPIPGVNIMIKGTTIGVVTAYDGTFNITVPSPNSILVFSFVGYAPKEIPVDNQTQIKIVMDEESKLIDEVVVVGYGVQKRSELTGSIASVKATEIKDVSAKSLSEAISGRVAGVMVTKGSGKPGEAANIIIRGAGSVNGLGPLYIVDGVRMGTDFNFNMRDVESIEILKDAGSSAIYGAQAAGGVILITTKRGKASNKTNVDINARFGLRNAVNSFKLLDRDQYIDAYKQIGIDIPVLEGKSASQLPNTDWMDLMYGQGKEQEYNISLSGGGDKYNYFLSAGYYREDGIYVDNWAQRFSLRANSDYKIGKRITVGESLYASKRNNNPLRNETMATIPFRSTPTMEVYDPDNLGGWAKAPSYFQGGNVLANEMIYHYSNNDYTLEGNIYGNLMIIEGLNLRITLGGAFGGKSSNAYTEAYDWGPVNNPNASMQAKAGTWQNLTSNATLTYEKAFGNHSIKLMAGAEALKNDGYNTTVNATTFSIPIAESIRLSTNANKTAEDEFPLKRTLSYFGRINYAYMGKYLITANIRRDGSDKFGPNNRWGTFPSINGAWRASEESFIKDNISWLSNLKIRASWGILGNDGIDQFLYEGAYKQISLHNFGGTGLKQSWGNTKFANESIKWEEVNQTDIGVDFGFLNHRLTFTFDWYNRQTKDMLYKMDLPLSSGLGNYNSNPSQMPINIGQVQNIGSEISVTWRETRNSFYYSIGANASFNSNKVIKIGQEGKVLTDGSPGAAWNASTSRTQDDHPMGQFYGYKAIGIFQSDTQVQEYNAKAKAAGAASGYYQKEGTQAGDLIFDDKGAGYVSEASRDFIGNPWPKMVYGVNIDLAYKGFDLNMLFQGVAGADIYNGTKAYTNAVYGDYNTTADFFKCSYLGSNGLTDMPRFGYYDSSDTYIRDANGNYKEISSFWIENGSYLKLKNLSFGYTLPSNISKKALIQNARVYISIQNLFTITGYSGMDPEIAGDVRARGIDNIDRYTPTRLVSFGLDLTF